MYRSCRTKSGVTKSQPGFFTIVVLPQFQSFCNVFPAVSPMLAAVKDNYQVGGAAKKDRGTGFGSISGSVHMLFFHAAVMDNHQVSGAAEKDCGTGF